MATIYLQQFLSRSNVASRRRATALIKSGLVSINGTPAILGAKVDPLSDQIAINGQLVIPVNKFVYYALNKPAGYACSLYDPRARKTVVSLVPAHPKVWPVGRLDLDSRGLLVMTNDGILTQKLTHPSFRHEKEYFVTLDKPVIDGDLKRLQRGVRLSEGLAAVDSCQKISQRQISLVIHQGWKRQIRRMLAALGYNVLDLLRVRVASLRLGSLREGHYKKIACPF